MAGLGTKLWTSGEVVTAAGVNGYLQDQIIGTYASTTARDAAFGGAGEPTLSEGMFAYTTDTNTLWLYSGATNGWVNLLGSDIGQQALSNRNVIINGAMQVAQRGTSSAGLSTAGGYFTADRWRFGQSGNDIVYTQSVEADYPSGSGFSRSLKMLVTTADASLDAADLSQIQTRLEGQNLQQFAKGTASAKQFALSFWVKSNTTGTYIAELSDIDNTRSVSASYTINASATWEKKTIIFPADATGLFDNDNAVSLDANFWLSAGTTYTSGTLATTWGATTTANRAVGQTNLGATLNNYWQVTGVQLEAGAVATPFEFEDFGVTLAKCQRYYYQTIGESNGRLGYGNASSATAAEFLISLPTTMRSTPSSVVSSTLQLFDGVSVFPVTAVTLVGAGQSRNTATIGTTVASGLTQYRPYEILNAASTSAYIGFSAEL